MKYVVKVADKQYEVEIEDIHARPVIARIDGQEFEVNPEDGPKLAVQKEAQELKSVELSKQPSSSSAGASELTAPLPGNVIEVFVKPGEHIENCRFPRAAVADQSYFHETILPHPRIKASNLAGNSRRINCAKRMSAERLCRRSAQKKARPQITW